jgi:ATP-dependent Clp endopeptidase proteolytic subunit ClpP
MRRPFHFKEKSNEEVDLHIYGAIGWNEADWGDGTNNTAFALVSLIKRLDKSYGRINVHINSPGGLIDDGLAIYNTLKSAKAEVHTYNSGLTASMASILMLAGTSHFPKTSIYHLHRASTIAFGNVNDFEQEIQNLIVFEAALIQAIADKTGMDEEEIKEKWFDGKEHYMTAEQAAEFGFVDFLEDTAAKTPAKIENLEKLRFNEVMNLYNNIENSETEPRFWDKIKSLFIQQQFDNNPLKNSTDMGTFALKAKLTVLLAIMGLQELLFNDGKAGITPDEAFRINDELESRENEINGLKTENAALREQTERMQATITDLEAKLASAPGAPAVNIKSNDNVQPPSNNDNATADVMSKVHEYNRQSGLYK